MTTLKDLQESFQRALLEQDDAILSHISASEKEEKHVLLGVYQNAYVLRLVEFLNNDYKKLSAYLGEDEFNKIARDFIAAHPSQTANARWFGDKFPDFLVASPAGRKALEYSEIAFLERALNDVFDAPDETRLVLDDIASLAPEVWSELCFRAHPAIRRLKLTTNAATLWSALHNNETLPDACKNDEPVDLLIYRSENRALFRGMSYEEALLWDELSRGVSFGVLCELSATYGGEDEAPARAGGCLKIWIEQGLLSEILT